MRRFFLCLALASSALAQQPAPCEGLLTQSHVLPAWPGLVLEVPSGDTLVVQLKDIGIRRIRLAGLRAPSSADSLTAVSRYHLSRLAKGLRIFVALDPPWKIWPQNLVAPVEDFTEAQLAAGMGSFVPTEADLLGPYLTCRCQTAQEAAKLAKTGIWNGP